MQLSERITIQAFAHLTMFSGLKGSFNKAWCGMSYHLWGMHTYVCLQQVLRLIMKAKHEIVWFWKLSFSNFHSLWGSLAHSLFKKDFSSLSYKAISLWSRDRTSSISGEHQQTSIFCLSFPTFCVPERGPHINAFSIIFIWCIFSTAPSLRTCTNPSRQAICRWRDG